jgi:hypothetical protein
MLIFPRLYREMVTVSSYSFKILVSAAEVSMLSLDCLVSSQFTLTATATCLIAHNNDNNDHLAITELGHLY